MSFVAAAIIGSAALGAGASVASGRQARKAAKSAQKKQEINDAYANLMNMMMGGQARSTPVQPIQGSTGTDALSGLSNIAAAYANAQVAKSVLGKTQAETARLKAQSDSSLLNMNDIMRARSNMAPAGPANYQPGMFIPGG